MQNDDAAILNDAFRMVRTTGYPLNPDDRFLKYEVIKKWRARGVKFDENRVLGDYGTWSRVRELRKQFPTADVEKLYVALKRAGQLLLDAAELSDFYASKDECLAQLKPLYPDFPDDLLHTAVIDARSSWRGTGSEGGSRIFETSMGAEDVKILNRAYRLVCGRGGLAEPDDRFLAIELIKQWHARGVQFNEDAILGAYGTWSRVRELRKDFPSAGVETLYLAVESASALRLKAQLLALQLKTEVITPTECLAQLKGLFPEFPEALISDSFSEAVDGK